MNREQKAIRNVLLEGMRNDLTHFFPEEAEHVTMQDLIDLLDPFVEKHFKEKDTHE